jgi:hypothetical protein
MEDYRDALIRKFLESSFAMYKRKNGRSPATLDEMFDALELGLQTQRKSIN